MDIDRVKKGETNVKTTPSTEVSTPTAKSTTATPVSTEGGIVTSAARSIDNIVSGKATNKDYDLFKVGQTANRQAFEDATGIKLPATNSETRKLLRDFANKTPLERSLSHLPEAQRNSIIETANKINIEGTGKTTEQIVAEVSNITNNVSANIKNQFGIDVDNGRLLEINLKALADNPENIISNDFVRGYSEVIGEKLTGINPKTLENNYFGKAPLGGKLADYGNKFKTVVDSSAQRLKAEYEGTQSTKVEAETPNTRTDIPTYEEYKAEIEKHYPGIDEKYIQERYNARYSVVESPDVRSEATDIRIEVTNKVPAELEKTIKAVKVRTGIDIVFGNRYVDGEIDTNFRGLFDGKRKIIVSENATKADVFNAVVLHELTHGIEGTKKYNAIFDYVVKELYGDDTARLDADVKTKIAEYKKNGIELTPEKARTEIVAENVGKYIFADDVGSIVTKNYTLGQKIFDVINELIYKLRKRFGNTFDFDDLASAQRKYRLALDEVKRNGVKTVDGKYSIFNSFYSEYDKWIARGASYDTTLEVGRTSEALRSIGIDDKKIKWDTKKIKKIKAEHNLNDKIIKQVPEIIENPVIIMDSLQKQSRLTILGEVYDLNNKPVLAVLELEPTNRKGEIILDEIKIASAYGKDNVQNLINNSNILYIDKNKKRINNWLTLNRLQLPLGQTNYQFSNDIVSQKNTDVNNNYMQNSKNDSATAEKTEMQLAYEKALAKSNGNEQYSFASQKDIDSALADFEAHYGEMYSNLIDKYKSIKPGEIPQVEDVKVPKKSGKRQYVSYYARTMAETRVFSEAMQGEFEKMVVDGTLSHERISNKSAERNATAKIEELGLKNAFE